MEIQPIQYGYIFSSIGDLHVHASSGRVLMAFPCISIGRLHVFTWLSQNDSNWQQTGEKALTSGQRPGFTSISWQRLLIARGFLGFFFPQPQILTQ